MTFLTNAVAWFARHGVTVERVMSDNGSAYVSYRFRDLCQAINIRYLRIKPHRPQTNGKVEWFIQTMLREWAYRFSSNSSEERKQWLEPYLHFYNFHRAHSSRWLSIAVPNVASDSPGSISLAFVDDDEFSGFFDRPITRD